MIDQRCLVHHLHHDGSQRSSLSLPSSPPLSSISWKWLQSSMLVEWFSLLGTVAILLMSTLVHQQCLWPSRATLVLSLLFLPYFWCRWGRRRRGRSKTTTTTSTWAVVASILHHRKWWTRTWPVSNVVIWCTLLLLLVNHSSPILAHEHHQSKPAATSASMNNGGGGHPQQQGPVKQGEFAARKWEFSPSRDSRVQVYGRPLERCSSNHFCSVIISACQCPLPEEKKQENCFWL